MAFGEAHKTFAQKIIEAFSLLTAEQLDYIASQIGYHGGTSPPQEVLSNGYFPQGW